MRLGVLLGLAVCLVSIACAEDLSSPVTGEAKIAFLTQWGERLRSMRSLHMVFTQEKQLRMLRQPLVAQGWLQRDTTQPTAASLYSREMVLWLTLKLRPMSANASPAARRIMSE